MNISLKYYKASLFVLVIFLLVILISAAFDALIIVNGKLKLPSVTALIGSILILYNRYLWKLPIFSLLVKVKNISGRYEGSLHYTWKDVAEAKKCAVEIYQTASSISIWMYTEGVNGKNSSSKSSSEDLILTDDNCQLVSLYNNYGSKDNELSSHIGVNIFQVQYKSKKRIVLDGIYFTDRKPQTRGRIKVKLVLRKLKHHF